MEPVATARCVPTRFMYVVSGAADSAVSSVCRRMAMSVTVVMTMDTNSTEPAGRANRR